MAAGNTVLNSRLAQFTSTIFAEMSALAQATGSVNLGQGFPDTDGPAEIAESAIEAIRSGHNQYPPGIGIESLRSAIASHQFHYYNTLLDPATQVLVTTGATEAIAAAIISLCEYGDEVVLFEPYYDSYAASVAIAGAKRRVVRLEAPNWHFDSASLEAAISPSTRAIVLNSPHNPTGKVFSQDELNAIAEVAIRNDLIVISDEVYEHLTFERSHISIGTLPGMAERTLTISSAAKSFSYTGWKIGWVTGPETLVAAVRASKQFLTYVSGAPFQVAIAHALDNCERLIPQVLEPLRVQREQLREALSSVNLEPFPSYGTYFLVTDVSEIASTDTYQFCVNLAHEAGVVAVPTSVFYSEPSTAPKHVRWTYCKRPEVIQQAADRLRQYFN